MSVSLAFSGVNAEAIIAGALATTAVSSVLLFAASPFRPRLLRRRDAVGDIAGFGVPAALAGLVHVGFANADYVILAARLSPTSAGLYWRAFQLGVSYQEKISGIMLRIAFPLYARTTDRDELRRLHERATRLHATTVLPLLALLIVTAPVLIPWLFGPEWRGAIVPSQLLAVAGMVGGRHDRLPAGHARRGQAAAAAALQPRDARLLRRRGPAGRAARADGGLHHRGRRPSGDPRRRLPAAAVAVRRGADAPAGDGRRCPRSGAACALLGVGFAVRDALGGRRRRCCSPRSASSAARRTWSASASFPRGVGRRRAGHRRVVPARRRARPAVPAFSPGAP